MTDETQVKVQLENHEQRIISVEHRVKDLETDNKVIMELSNSVQKLAINMEQMLEEQRDQGARLKLLEDEPKQNWEMIRRTIITAICSTLAGAVASAIIYFCAHSL